ncbi:hypothetical protein AAFF_G00346120 [Aldrovandia affinis]|uniref:Uncharacterized protein n=1 Tax=Aldrovandia affinis TaxID=143900 RepID=A0AAD7SJF0_9TELE|nr:hypothetical protein AAFF_G00346120 [Aldrovandia affinis]
MSRPVAGFQDAALNSPPARPLRRPASTVAPPSLPQLVFPPLLPPLELPKLVTNGCAGQVSGGVSQGQACAGVRPRAGVRQGQDVQVPLRWLGRWRRCGSCAVVLFGDVGKSGPAP